jgi:hypothetical protein
MPGMRSFQKSLLESAFMLVLLAILAGILGGGVVGLATAHHAPAATSSSAGLGQ